MVSEGQRSLKVCVELVGSLSNLAQVTLSTMDYSAVGRSYLSVSNYTTTFSLHMKYSLMQFDHSNHIVYL